eukprot:CAMPEP_0118707064 /NCGR_PEP_ID=MMETSP0800-20121206/20958_1 /TAXON_ID=210618 ORGANISM="Striatella unipunctata, Strain CCMP2910" /NCGR_SAMPLE_ID=MMETSP0800 /ASSEMBLY_ACC=CAM_ASM_000638 /LENGTH=151 /DNA_ID=CAMNT_0006609773 /DNA_START=54 /DNA_END=509 /DNA_ORIENTATION=-
MTYSIQVPNEYGYVILTCIVGPMVSSLYMGGVVGGARKKYNVPYPNMYATPKHHEKADEFNRVQRGHQNFFENVTSFSVAALVGGLKHPYTCAVYGILFSVGSILFQIGYSDTNLDVKLARYKKGGAIKHIGFLGSVGAAISLAGSMLEWW